MSITKSISEGFRLAISIKRILPVLIINLVIFYSLITLMKQVFNFVTFLQNPFVLLGSFGLYIILFIIIALVNLWITGALTHQSKYPKKSLTSSFEFALSKYVILFVSAIISSVIAVILSIPQYIGWLLALVWGLIVFYLQPAIIIGNRGVIESFKESWKVFKKFPLETFVTWLLVSIICIIIIAIFTVPMIFYLLGSILGSLPMDETLYANETLAEDLIMTEIFPKSIETLNSPIFLVYFFIFCVGISFQKVFGVCTKAMLYVNLRKGRKSLDEE